MQISTVRFSQSAQFLGFGLMLSPRNVCPFFISIEQLFAFIMTEALWGEGVYVTEYNLAYYLSTMSKDPLQNRDKVTKEALKPVTKVNTKLDKELQEWEVESTKDGQDSQGNG